MFRNKDTENMKVIAIAVAAILISSANAFSFQNTGTRIIKSAETSTFDDASTSRRSLLQKSLGLITSGLVSTTLLPKEAVAEYRLGDPNSVVGREILSFNSLIYNFKNTALNGGLKASTLTEPSIPFTEFGEKMKNGDVTFVEFIAPYGDAAYATIKSGKDSKEVTRIRIGEGYPLESKDSWTSPAYVIRSVSNFGVPYKFTVPMLARYK